MTARVPLRIAPLLLALATGCATPTPELPEGGARLEPVAPPAEEGDVLLARLGGSVRVQAPDERASIPILSGGERTVRVAAGTRVLVGPGARAVLTFPDGSDVMVIDDASLEVLDPKRGALVRAGSLRFLSVDLRGQGTVELPGGTLAQGNGSRFVVRRIRERILRLETRGGSAATVQRGGATVALEAGRFVEVPYNHVGARGAN